MIKIIATDIDGTITENNAFLTEALKETIQTVRNKGIKFGLATGRPIDSLKAVIPDAEDIFDFAICDNGGYVYDFSDGDVHEQFPLEGDLIRKLIETYLPMGANPILTGDNIFYTQFEDAHNIEVRKYMNFTYVNVVDYLKNHHAKIMFSGDEKTLKNVEKHAHENSDPRYVSFYSQSDLYEFMDPRVNKMVGLNYYLEKNNVGADELLVFGDNDNDVQMLEGAGIGVAVGNATQRAKNAADHITDASAGEGVISFLKTII